MYVYTQNPLDTSAGNPSYYHSFLWNQSGTHFICRDRHTLKSSVFKCANGSILFLWTGPEISIPDKNGSCTKCCREAMVGWDGDTVICSLSNGITIVLDMETGAPLKIEKTNSDVECPLIIWHKSGMDHLFGI
jgi:hypothetical protein